MSHTKKILHIISSANPRGGGPIESLIQGSPIFRRLGYRDTVLSLDSPEAAFLRELPLEVIALGPGYTPYQYAPKLTRWLLNHAREYDHIIIHGLWQYHAFGAYRALKQLGQPYFLFTHGMLDPWFKQAYPLKHLKKWCFWPWSDYRVLRDAKAVLFTCEEEKLLARKSFWLYRATERVVKYGTSIPTGDPAAQNKAFLSQFPQLENRKLLLFLSRIHPKKGCDLLISAIADTFSAHPDYQVVLAGPDQTGWQATLTRQAENLGVSDRITWTGMLTGDVKWGAYRAAEAFILPSHQENFGIVVAEALAVGLPVLITRKVNIWREVADFQAGLVAEDTLTGTKCLINEWLSKSPAEVQQYRENAHRCFQQCFEINQAIQSLIEVIA